ncbi:MAG: hypothetical protein ACK5EO_04940, partial [Planctomycetota bacterium]
MFGFNRLSIQSKMILLLLLVALSALAVMAWIGYVTGKSSLEKSVQNQLKGIQVAKTTALKTRLESLRDQVVSMSDSSIVLEGMKSFAKAFDDLEQASLSPEQSQQVQDFYTKTFIPKLKEHITTEPLVEQYIPSNPISNYLQYHYVAANPHPYESKSLLIDATGDTTSYRAIHEQLHPSFARAAKIFGFEDILLIDSRNLNIVYSYAKTSEFATSLETGPYSNTKLARKARELQSAQDRDAYKIADFEAYR